MNSLLTLSLSLGWPAMEEPAPPPWSRDSGGKPADTDAQDCQDVFLGV